jgi:nitrate/nitrite transporter NarK
VKAKDLGVLITLMLIGEGIFFLPFVITRIFRPTFLTVFNITNYELGTAFSFYGIVAMFSYFFGGPIADRFAPKQILPVAFIATSAAGFIMATIPSIGTLSILYACWGVTTILMFWASYIKVQRAFGGQFAQGKSFGLVDAGRGFIAAATASASIFLLDGLLPVSAENATQAELTPALQWIIRSFAIATALCAPLIWWVFRGDRYDSIQVVQLSLSGVKSVMGKPTVWLQAFIVLCAYVGYKVTDDFSLYAKVAFNYNDVDAAHMASVSFWVRPIAAVAAGFLGDRLIHSRVIAASFVIMLIGCITIGTGILKPGMETVIVFTIASISAGIYGLRGLYFALFQESGLPILYTGSAAGLVSVIGYTPDIFMGPIMGLILDNNPGAIGHQYLFLFVGIFAFLGTIAAFSFRKFIPKSIAA